MGDQLPAILTSCVQQCLKLLSTRSQVAKVVKAMESDKQLSPQLLQKARETIFYRESIYLDVST